MDSSTKQQRAGTAAAEQRIAVKVMLPKSLDRAVEIEAVKRDWKKQELIERAISAYLEQLKHAA